jgi:mRNA interferase MazF
MKIKQYEIWIADLNPKMGTESGKTRPVVIIQTNLLNRIPHPSTMICPVTTNVKKSAEVLRVHLKKDLADLRQDGDIMIDQIRAIDNRRLVKKVGELPFEIIEKVKDNVRICLDLN